MILINRFFLLVLGVLLEVSQVSAQSGASFRFFPSNASGQGLNDAAAALPVSGNTATTRGQQFQNVILAAADFWGARLSSGVPIDVDVSMSDELACGSSGGVLGGAGPGNAFVIPNGVPNTLYTSAQADSLVGNDLDLQFFDINMEFNNRIGQPGCLSGVNWWLGINSPAPSGTVSFYDTVLHELAHGLGFLTFVDQQGRRPNNRNDPFMLNLFDDDFNASWDGLTDSQRAASSVNNGSLAWNGALVTQNIGDFSSSSSKSGRLRLYAPTGFQQGSSVSHWDTALSPDELMEPSATATSVSCATVAAFADMGWVATPFAINTCNLTSLLPVSAFNPAFIPAVILELLLSDD